MRSCPFFTCEPAMFQQKEEEMMRLGDVTVPLIDTLRIQ